MLGRARYVAIAVPMILVITAAYHLGYPQYRQDGVAKPEVGNTLISIPMLGHHEPDRLDRRTHRDARHGGDALVRDDDLPAAADGQLSPSITTICEW